MMERETKKLMCLVMFLVTMICRLLKPLTTGKEHYARFLAVGFQSCMDSVLLHGLTGYTSFHSKAPSNLSYMRGFITPCCVGVKHSVVSQSVSLSVNVLNISWANQFGST